MPPSSVSGQRNFALPVAVLLLFLGALLLVWAVNSFNAKPSPVGAGTPTLATNGGGTGLNDGPPPSNKPSTAVSDLAGGSPKLPGAVGAAGTRTSSNAEALPLHEAAGRGDLEALKAHLARGLDVNAPLRGQNADRQGMTPLMSAVISAGSETVKALIGLKASVNAKSDDGFTALHFASERGTLANLQALLKADANPELTNQAGETPLMLAARAGSVDKVLALMTAGASVTPRDKMGNSAVAYAAASNADALVVKVLLDADSDPNVADIQGITPLMKAVERGDVQKVVALLNAGAVLRAKDAAGRTAMDRAKSRTDTSGVKITGVLSDAGDF